MITEVRDPSIVNGFANHPEVAPLIGSDGTMDLSDAMREPNVLLFGEHGGFTFMWTAPGTFEVHVMLTRAGRGRWGFAAGKEGVRQMAARGATHLWACVHPERNEIGLFARMAGFADTGLRLDRDGTRWRIFNWKA